MNRYFALSWVAIGSIGIIITGGVFFYFFFLPALDGPPRILLPDSAILLPALESPEGKAFIARYPDYKSTVMQDFYGMSAFDSRYTCCTVELFHGTDDKAIILHSKVSATSDLKTITVDDTELECLVSDGFGWGGWMIKEDVTKSLQHGQPDCWEFRPPTPSDQELIEIASNTAIGKAYLASYPENNYVIQRLDPFWDHSTVIFTPKVSEPIKYVTRFGGLEWQISETYIVCSYGDYKYPSDPEFWSYFDPNNACLESVHDRLLVANETAQVKDFQAKYPEVRLHGVDHSSRFTVYATETTINYLWTDPSGNEATLTVMFKPATTAVVNFEVECGEEASDQGTPPHKSKSGMNLDVAEFLQDASCPAPFPLPEESLIR